MAQMTIEVNGKPYTVGCDDGQESHLLELARLFDDQVRAVAVDMGQLGDTRLFLMGALLMADELAEARARLDRLNAELNGAEDRHARAETRAAAALEAAARHIDAIAAD